MELNHGQHRFARRAPLRGRAQKRGMAVFIVTLAIMVLSGVGVWAVYSSGMSDAASGSVRASAQTMYLSEMGILVNSAFLALSGQAGENLRDAEPDTSGNRDACFSVPNMTQPCRSMTMDDMQKEFWRVTTGANNVLLDPNAEGSMGAFASTAPGYVVGNFFVEMSDPKPINVPGGATGGSYQRVALTSYGIIRPPSASLCTGAQSENAVASRLAMRAYMIIGPVPQATQSP